MSASRTTESKSKKTLIHTLVGERKHTENAHFHKQKKEASKVSKTLRGQEKPNPRRSRSPYRERPGAPFAAQISPAPVVLALLIPAQNNTFESVFWRNQWPPTDPQLFCVSQPIENSEKIHSQSSRGVPQVLAISDFMIACALRYARVKWAKHWKNCGEIRSFH